jgi:hypothetical protein
MARYNPMVSGGDPVKTMQVRRGHILLDRDNRVVTDEHGEAFTYPDNDAAEAAIRNFKSEE